jgi:hypothetical protein
MRSIGLVAFVGVLGLLPACGDTEGDDATSSGVPLEDLPAKYADAACAAYTACMGDLLEVFRPGEDCARALAIKLEEELPALQEAIDAGRVTYDGSKVESCVNELSGFGCAELLNRAPDSCQAVTIGSLALGDDCTIDDECAGTDVFCDFDAACPGTCSKLGVQGDPCQRDSDCRSGLSCFNETGSCVAPGKEGDLCQQGEPDCAPGFICLGEDSEAKTPGSCVAIDEAFSGAVGDPCDLKTRLCDIDASCEVKSVLPSLATECAPKVKSGEACRVALPDQCPSDEYCDVPLASLSGTCKTKPKAGEPCAGAGFDPARAPSICEPGARCDMGVCRALAHLGEQCSENDTCYSGRCLDGACVASNACR